MSYLAYICKSVGVFTCERVSIMYNSVLVGVPGGLIGGPRAIKITFVGSSLTECRLVGAFSFIKKVIVYSGKRESVS